jgi:hypothetical protein
MKPESFRRFQTRFGPITDASSSWMQLASVDATERTKKSLFVRSVCRKHHYHSGSSLPQLAAGDAIGNRISGSLLPRLCGGEGLGMRGHSARTYCELRRKLTRSKPLSPSPSPRSGARGARVKTRHSATRSWAAEQKHSVDRRSQPHVSTTLGWTNLCVVVRLRTRFGLHHLCDFRGLRTCSWPTPVCLEMTAGPAPVTASGVSWQLATGSIQTQKEGAARPNRSVDGGMRVGAHGSVRHDSASATQA